MSDKLNSEQNISVKQFTVGELATIIDAKLQGNKDQIIHGLATLQQADSGQLSFLANPTFKKYLSTTQASAVILREQDSEGFEGNALIIDNPYLAYARLTALFNPVQHSIGIHPSASIDDSVQLGDKLSIGANVVIGADAVIGDNCVIGAGVVIGEGSSIGANSFFYPNVSVYHNVHMGEACIVHSGVVVGSDGFGFAPDGEKRVKIHQLGGVRIGNDVELGAGTCIDRGALDDTVLGDGVKTDNLVHIAHNVKIGNNTVMCGCSGVAGSSTIGNNCVIAGAVGIINHVTIVDDVTVTAGTLVTKSIKEPGVYSSGTPMMLNADWRKNAATFARLHGMYQNLKKLEKT